MFFLTNMYERRFNDNMNRHRLDAKIAPQKPKPACRFIQSNDTTREQKQAVLSQYHLTNELKTEVPAIGQQSPPNYQDSFINQSTTVSQSSLLEVQNSVPAAIGIKPFKRTNSNESGFYTGGDSDVASNFSVTA